MKHQKQALAVLLSLAMILSSFTPATVYASEIPGGYEEASQAGGEGILPDGGKEEDPLSPGEAGSLQDAGSLSGQVVEKEDAMPAAQSENAVPEGLSENAVPEAVSQDEAVPVAGGAADSVLTEAASDFRTADWNELQAFIDSAEDGVERRISLSTDVRNSYSFGDVRPLTIPAGKVIQLDLSGNKLDFNRAVTDYYSENGHVIQVEEGAVLTIIDSGDGNGMITGGFARLGGGILNKGNLTIQGVKITGNKATINGGGIYNDTNASLTINGANIFGNKTTEGAEQGLGSGLYVKNDAGDVAIQGQVIIENNQSEAGEPDVFLGKDRAFVLSGKLTEGSKFYVGKEGDTGLIAKDFTKYNGDGEARTFFTSTKGYGFILKDGNVWLGSIWAELQKMINDAENESTITLQQDYTADSKDDRLKMPKKKKLTLNLNGHTLNRNRSKSDKNGHVIEVLGELTIVGDGTIKGGYAEHGGGICIGEDGVLNLNGGTITLNRSSADGGGIYNKNVLNIDGGKIIDNYSSDTGGGIFCTGDARLYINHAEICSNTAKNTGGGIRLHLDKDAVIENSWIAYNKTEKGDGGGINMDTGKTLTIKNTLVEGNTSHEDGGGIYQFEKGRLYLEGCTISGNHSGIDGGGIFSKTEKEVRITDTVIIGNIAEESGGGAWMKDGDLEVAGDQTLIIDNEAKKNGGGLLVNGSDGMFDSNDGEIWLKGGTIIQNKAGNLGGGIFVEDTSDGIKLYGDAKILVLDNTAINGDNLCLDSGKKLEFTGPLHPDTRLAVDLKKGTGTLTKNYGKKTGITDLNDENNILINTGYFTKIDDKEIKISSRWKDLQNLFDHLGPGDNPTVSLDKDYTAGPDDDRLELDKKKTFTLDLCGHTIDRNRSSSDKDGHVMEIYNGTDLTIMDSVGGGKITGGYATKGGAINNKGTLTIEGGVITGNRAEEGGGIYSYGALTISGGSISGNEATDDYGGGIYANSGVTMTGGSIEGNYSQKDAGGIYTKGSSSITGGVIRDNTAKRSGGGILTDGSAVVTLSENCDITGNLAEGGSGGAVYAGGSSQLKVVEGSVSGNYAGDCGGAFCFGGDSCFEISGGTITDNSSGNKGGAIYIGNTKVQEIKGDPVITDNIGRGSDIYLKNGQKLTLSDTLSEDADIGVCLEDGWGEFTVNLRANTKEKSQEENPALYFHSPEGYGISLTEGGEAQMGIESYGQDPNRPFIEKDDQVADPATLTGRNWMSGISGERHLNEINISGSHDSAMNEVRSYRTSSKGSFFGGADYAKTQVRFIDEQLNEGTRLLDLRVNNKYEEPNDVLGTHELDDGMNLYLCHGKNPNAGTYWAEDHEGNRLTIDKVFYWVKDFLKKHPTEVVILDFEAETQHSSDKPIIWSRLDQKLRILAEEINPSTGKKYVYYPNDGGFGTKFTEYPQLKDCRGQIILMGGSGDYPFGGIQDYSMGGKLEVSSPEGSYSDLMDKRIARIREYLDNNGDIDLPTIGQDAWLSIMHKVGTNGAPTKDYPVVGKLPTNTPLEVVAEVDKKLFQKGYFNKKGKYLGLVRIDSAQEKYNKQIWGTNFFDGLEYCDVTVKSGFEGTSLASKYPTQRFKILQSTLINMPDCLYDIANLSETEKIGGDGKEKFFTGWIRVDGGSGVVMEPGDAWRIPAKESITLSANWVTPQEPSPEPTPESVLWTNTSLIWNDQNDADGLRATVSELKIRYKVDGSGDWKEQSISKNEAGKWRTALSGNILSANDIQPVWEGHIGNNPNVPGKYSYRVIGRKGLAFFILLTHIPPQKITVSGNIRWVDAEGREKPGSVSVNLYKNGEFLLSQDVSGDGDVWHYEFAEQPEYEGYGESSRKNVYTIVPGSEDLRKYGYTAYGLGRDVICLPIRTNVQCQVLWEDDDDAGGIRPEEVTLHLWRGTAPGLDPEDEEPKKMENQEEISSKTVRASDDWMWNFDQLYAYDEDGNELVYAVSEDAVNGYNTSIERDGTCFITNTAIGPDPGDVISLELITDKAKTEYSYGESLDVTGLYLVVSKAGGAREVVDVTEDMVSGFNSTMLGEQTLTVIYGARQTSYTVYVRFDPPKDLLKRFVIHYIVGYNGKQMSKHTDPVGEWMLNKKTDTEWVIPYDETFYKRNAVPALLKGDEKGVVSYTIVGKAVYADGTQERDKKGQPIPEMTWVWKADEFEEGQVTVPVSYNDIYVYANVGAYATGDGTEGCVVISNPAGVRYSGLPHKLADDPAALGKDAGEKVDYDIRLTIQDLKVDGSPYELVYGRDYTASYRNNRNASVNMGSQIGEYTQRYDQSEAATRWPQVIITGIGNYAGMKAVVYFDILPLSIYDSCKKVGSLVKEGSVAKAYVLNKKGGLSLTPEPARYGMNYNSRLGKYVMNTDKKVRYKLGTEVKVELLYKDNDADRWRRIGNITGAFSRRAVLKTVNKPGTYRIAVEGCNNFYGSHAEEFEVYKQGKVLFSSLKVSKKELKFVTPGIEGKTLVTGIKTKVKTLTGENVLINPSEYTVTLKPLSKAAVSSNDGKAMTAGRYLAVIEPVGQAIKLKYPYIAWDSPIETVVTVRGKKLSKKMFRTDWSREGEIYTGDSKPVVITASGIAQDEFTLGKEVVNGKRKTYVPLDEDELKEAVASVSEGGIEVNGSYRLNDGTLEDNTLPGHYKVVLYGLGKYADSHLVLTVKRVGKEIAGGDLSANAVKYNAAGAMPVIKVMRPDQKTDIIGVEGSPDYKVTWKSNKRPGTGTAVVRVRNSATGFKKGSAAKVEFTIEEAEIEDTDILRYGEALSQNRGKVFLQMADTVKTGGNPPVVTLYQESPDGKALVPVPRKAYNASFTDHDLVLSNGQESWLQLGDGITIKDTYQEYGKKVENWSGMKTLSVSGSAAVIRNRKDGRIYDSTNMSAYMGDTTEVQKDAEGNVTVKYVGNCYVLPKIEEIYAEGRLLKLSEGDYVISYQKNNRIGTAKMTVTISREAAKKYGIGGSKTYTFQIKPQKNNDLNL